MKHDPPVSARHSTLLIKYGISESGYDMLLADQEGVCAICGDPPGPKRSLCVDHCHETGRIRGLLCNRCNLGLGFFRDAENVMANAIDYLRRSDAFE